MTPEQQAARTVDAAGLLMEATKGLPETALSRSEDAEKVNTGMSNGGAGTGSGCTRGAGAPDPPGLPCLLSEQLNPTTTRKGLPPKHRKLAVELEVQGLVMRYGVERIGFLTFTFADDVRTVPEASRRMNSLQTHHLSKRYPEWLSVVQRHKDGKIHFHLVVVMAEDIRTGFDFAQVRRRDYSSASPYLKAEWKWLRATLPEYGFGRHELLPVKMAESFGRYIARYVAGNTKRQECDRGARLVRFSRSFVRTVCGPFSSWNFQSKRVRARQAELRTRFPGLEPSLDRQWDPAVKAWLMWLLWSCPKPYYDAILFRIEDDAEIYVGTALAAKEWVEHYRPIVARAQAQESTRRALWQGSGVGATPVRPKAVESHTFPGIAWLARS